MAAALVAGTPVPQGINTAEVLAADVSTPTIALGVLLQVVTVNIATLVAAAAAEGTSIASATDTKGELEATSSEYNYYTSSTSAHVLATSDPYPSATSSNVLTTADLYTSVSSADAYPTGELSKRSFLDRRSACTPQALGSEVVPSTDTAAAFSTFANFSASALLAMAPVSYVQTFSNLGVKQRSWLHGIHHAIHYKLSTTRPAMESLLVSVFASAMR